MLSLYAKNIMLDSEFLSDIAIGSNNDVVSVIMDTGSADLWMFSTECQTCQTTSPHKYYRPRDSTTFYNSSTTFELRYGDGSYTAGTVGSDTVTVAGAPIQGQSIDVPWHISANLLSNAMDGIMGLGFPSLSQIRMPTPLSNMLTQKIIPKAVLGLQYIKTRQWSYEGGGGAWTFGGWDTSAIVGALTWVDITEPVYWKINLPKVRVGSVYEYVPTQQVIVDSGTTLILLDPTSVANIHKYLPGGRLSATDGTGHWQIFCNATSDYYTGSRNVYFSIGGKDWGVPARDLAWYPEQAYPGYCYSLIQPWGESFGILGVAFLKNVYAVFDQDRAKFGLGT
ncbi:aspartic peptidase domain-containing protein, partial [Protomyces lactucae-debilis]